MAVEERRQPEQAEQRHRRRHLVDDGDVALGLAPEQRGAAGDAAQRRAQDVQPAADAPRQPAARQPDGERAVARLREAARLVVVRRVDRDGVAAPLRRHRRVDDEPLRAADAEVRVQEAHAQLLALALHRAHPALRARDEQRDDERARDAARRIGRNVWRTIERKTRYLSRGSILRGAC